MQVFDSCHLGFHYNNVLDSVHWVHATFLKRRSWSNGEDQLAEICDDSSSPASSSEIQPIGKSLPYSKVHFINLLLKIHYQCFKISIAIQPDNSSSFNEDVWQLFHRKNVHGFVCNKEQKCQMVWGLCIINHYALRLKTSEHRLIKAKLVQHLAVILCKFEQFPM